MVRSTQFADFICSKVLTNFGSLEVDIQTQVLKLLAEVCMFTGSLNEPREATQQLYKLLMDAVPTQATSDQEEGFDFTKLECLIYAFHTVSSQSPEYLAENSKDFKV